MSLIVDRITQVGRIHRASGTTLKRTFRRINDMITALQETGRLDILRDLRDGRLTLLAVYDAFRVNELHRLPTAAEMQPLKSSLWGWYDDAECGRKQKEANKTAINHVVALAPEDATVADLPRLIEKLRARLKGEGKHAQFNRDRAAIQAFVRDTMKRHHRLHAEVTQVDTLKERKQRRNNPQAYVALLHLSQNFEPDDWYALWTMALTGMGPSEYWGEWDVRTTSVHIEGTKRAGRVRDVPLVFPQAIRRPSTKGDPVWNARKFANALGEATDDAVQPYDLRRTYANWLEAAGIPRTRRMMYLGHAGGDVTSLYEWHEVTEFLEKDRKRLEQYLENEFKSVERNPDQHIGHPIRHPIPPREEEIESR